MRYNYFTLVRRAKSAGLKSQPSSLEPAAAAAAMTEQAQINIMMARAL